MPCNSALKGTILQAQVQVRAQMERHAHGLPGEVRVRQS